MTRQTSCRKKSPFSSIILTWFARVRPHTTLPSHGIYVGGIYLAGASHVAGVFHIQMEEVMSEQCCMYK